MSTCLNCGAEFEGETGLCASCKKADVLQRMHKTWKKQMRFYGVLMIVGLVVLGAIIPQLQGSHEEVPRQMYLVAAAGGLCLLGGLFGFSLAVFFQLWHSHKD